METFEEDDMPLSALQNLKQEKNNFSCPTCQSSFRKKTKLVQHQYYQHGFGIMCKICLRTFSNLSACVTHLSTKHSDQGYPCSHCDFKTTKQSEFRNHIQEQHNLSTQMGSIKVKEERNEDSSKNGESNHVKENAKGDASENIMVKELVNDKKKYICDLCGACFAIKNQLLKHNNEKHGLNVSCDICSQTFNSMVSLRSHKFTKHTGKDKICEICGYSTKKTYDFKRHQVKHSNIFTVKCVVCNKGFYSLYEFNEHKNVHTAERPYQCEICGVDYSRRSSLTLHRNRKHPEQYDSSKKCKICNQVCLTRDTMEAHVKTHLEGRKKFYCDICGKGLLTKVILKVHRRSHTGEKPFDCSYCGRAFSCKKNLSVHIRLHTGVRPYSCKYCWKAYTKSSALKAHEKIHSAPQNLPESEAVVKIEGPTATKLKFKELYDNSTKNSDLSSTKVQCELCGESYQKNLLQRHKKRHLKAQNAHKCELCQYSFTMMTKLVLHRKKTHGLEMSCDKCEKSFQNVHSFTTHIRNHKKEKSFVCDVCGLAMTEKRNLDKHKLVRHKIGEFPFQCKICKKGFLSNYFLNEHMNRHTGARPHQCHKCGSAYASFKNLERHNYRFHPELLKNKILRCKCCSRVFKSKKKLEIHEVEKHSNGRNVCDFCGKDFKYRESLIRHRRIHTGEKPKECVVCKKKFACANYLQNHMRTHTGEKPYQCRFCWKKFSQRSGVVTHEKIHLRGLKSSGLEIIPAVSKS